MIQISSEKRKSVLIRVILWAFMEKGKEVYQSVTIPDGLVFSFS